MKTIKNIFLIIVLLVTFGICYWLLAPFYTDKTLSAKLPFDTQQVKLIKNGIFIGNKGFESQGNAQVITYKNKKYIHFEDNFSISNGSDLYVYLNTNGNNKETINLGLLKKYNGAQLYLLPKDIDMDDYNEIWIWSNVYSVAFAKAILE